LIWLIRKPRESLIGKYFFEKCTLKETAVRLSIMSAIMLEDDAIRYFNICFLFIYFLQKEKDN